MADELLSNYQHVIESLTFMTGSGGVFDVAVDGELIFSKKKIQQRHAKEGEILKMFEEIVGPDVPKYPRSE